MNKKTTLKLASLSLASTLLLNTAFAEQPTEDKPSDARIEATLVTTYVFNTNLNPFEISVDSKDGVVQLSGAVDEEIDKDLAAEIAKGVDGVASVQNNIIVSENAKRKDENDNSFSQAVSDASTTASIKSKLLWNKNTDGLDISVGTKNGIVTLRGEVAKDAQIDLAETIATNTSGVREVNNKLKVASRADKSSQRASLGTVDLDKASENVGSAAKDVGTSISDAWVSTKVRSYLATSSVVDSSYIDVSTSKGSVILNGTVRNEFQKESAENIAANIKGVKKVENKLSTM